MLEDALKQHLNPALYGIGSAKTWESLLNEISAGECRIDFTEQQPIREIRLISIDVIAPNGAYLFEAYQEFSDKRRRERNLWGVSEKLKLGEELEQAAIRAMREELGVKQPHFTLSIDSMPEINEQESPSYPGLRSRYIKYKATANLSSEAVTDIYVEIQEDKKTVFVWRVKR